VAGRHRRAVTQFMGLAAISEAAGLYHPVGTASTAPEITLVVATPSDKF